jgi:hypothetical protein
MQALRAAEGAAAKMASHVGNNVLCGLSGKCMGMHKAVHVLLHAGGCFFFCSALYFVQGTGVALQSVLLSSTVADRSTAAGSA